MRTRVEGRTLVGSSKYFEMVGRERPLTSANSAIVRTGAWVMPDSIRETKTSLAEFLTRRKRFNSLQACLFEAHQPIAVLRPLPVLKTCTWTSPRRWRHRHADRHLRRLAHARFRRAAPSVRNGKFSHVKFIVDPNSDRPYRYPHQHAPSRCGHRLRWKRGRGFGRIFRSAACAAAHTPTC